LQTAAVRGNQRNLRGREKAFQEDEGDEDESDYGYCSVKAVSYQRSAFSFLMNAVSMRFNFGVSLPSSE
jgi:hypothetical protein